MYNRLLFVLLFFPQSRCQSESPITTTTLHFSPQASLRRNCYVVNPVFLTSGSQTLAGRTLFYLASNVDFTGVVRTDNSRKKPNRRCLLYIFILLRAGSPPYPTTSSRLYSACFVVQPEREERCCFMEFNIPPTPKRIREERETGTAFIARASSFSLRVRERERDWHSRGH